MVDTLISSKGEANGPPQAASRRPRARRWARIGLTVVALLAGLVVLAWAILFITKGRFLKPLFERIASRDLQRQVTVSGDFQLYFDPFDIEFRAGGLTIANPAWASKRNLFQARHIETRIATLPLIVGARRARWLDLDGAAVDTEWNADHSANSWTFGKSKAKPLELPVIERATATGSTLRYRDPRMQLAVDLAFDPIRSRDHSIAQAVGLGGAGSLRGYPFTLTGTLLSPNSTLTLGRTKLLLHAASGGSLMDVAGTLPSATRIEGGRLKLLVRGPNLRTLFDLLGVAAPDTRAYRFTSDLTKDQGKWRFTHLSGRFGDSDLAGRMTIAMPDDRLRLAADMRSHRVDIVDIGPFVGYNPEKLASGSVTAAASTQNGGGERILPDAPLRVDALRRFDAHVTYAAEIVRSAHWPISHIGLTFDLDHNRLALSPLTMDVAGGHLAADIGIDARSPRVLTHYDIRLSPTPIARALAGFGVNEAGTTGTLSARIDMAGVGDSVRKSLATANGRIAVLLPAGAVSTRNVQLSEFDIGVFLQKLLQHQLNKPVQINCGLIGFTVRDGIAAADPILIDTDKDVMTAQGTISFRDESLHLDFRSRAKTFSLFSGQAPIGITGHFADPRLQIVSPQLIARGAASVALGVVATPVAAILAFVDRGQTANTACGPVLAGAGAAAQHTVKGKPVKGLAPDHHRKKFLGIF